MAKKCIETRVSARGRLLRRQVEVVMTRASTKIMRDVMVICVQGGYNSRPAENDVPGKLQHS